MGGGASSSSATVAADIKQLGDEYLTYAEIAATKNIDGAFLHNANEDDMKVILDDNVSNSIHKDQLWLQWQSDIAHDTDCQVKPSLNTMCDDYNYTFVVATASVMADNHRESSVPLMDVFDCPEWRNAYTSSNCCSKLFLVKMTFEEFNSLPNALVLSYRWGHVESVNCQITAPGENPMKQNICRDVDLSIDAFWALKDLRDSFMWVDFLSHLNDPQHRNAVVNKMGHLYIQGRVFPLYLYAFCSELSTCEDVIEALRRGWIQQEISFGFLSHDVIFDFIVKCVNAKQYGLLGNLLRRRAAAMDFATGQRELDELDFTTEAKNSVAPTSTGVGKEELAEEMGLKKIFKGSPMLLVPSDSIRIAISAIFCAKIKEAIPDEHEIDLRLIKEELTDIGSADVENLANRMIAKHGTGPILPFINELANKICERQQFDYQKSAHAYQLLRSFAESELTYETDCYTAMTQCATLLAGLEWKIEELKSVTQCATLLTGLDLKIEELNIEELKSVLGVKDDKLKLEGENENPKNLAILQKCWKTVVDEVLSSNSSMSFRVNRKSPPARMVGLLRLIPLEQQQQENEKKSFTVEIKREKEKTPNSAYLHYFLNKEFMVLSPNLPDGCEITLSVTSIEELFFSLH